jgi:hypothetical protein
MFAEKYLKKQQRSPLVKHPPPKDLGMIVVIPCHREPDIILTLNSLNNCIQPNSRVEVLILINHSDVASRDVKNYNQKTREEVDKWIAGNRTEKIDFYVSGPVTLRKKWAGAGLARKTGMDEATRRFNLLGKPQGIIVSLDADTLVEKNYLDKIETHFRLHPGSIGATVVFEHQKQGLSRKHLEGIELYEKYLAYYKQALDFTGYPYSLFTVGSAFVVTAQAYVKRGGMNRRQAGEDFYFLQGLVQQGEVGEITSTKVYPSARLSDRVPFGTGPILRKWMNGEEDLTKTYKFQAFLDLKEFFKIKSELFQTEETDYMQFLKNLPESVARFLKEDKFWTELDDLNKNCSNIKTFQTRFFQKFNAFKILKFLNFVHEHFYEKEDINLQIKYLENAN